MNQSKQWEQQINELSVNGKLDDVIAKAVVHDAVLSVLLSAQERIQKEKQTSEKGYFYDEDNFEHQEFEESMQSQYETMGEAYHGGIDDGVRKALSIIHKRIKELGGE